MYVCILWATQPSVFCLRIYRVRDAVIVINIFQSITQIRVPTGLGPRLGHAKV